MIFILGGKTAHIPRFQNTITPKLLVPPIWITKTKGDKASPHWTILLNPIPTPTPEREKPHTHQNPKSLPSTTKPTHPNKNYKSTYLIRIPHNNPAHIRPKPKAFLSEPPVFSQGDNPDQTQTQSHLSTQNPEQTTMFPSVR